jgi:RNA polymerase sigma-54 factor
MELSAELSAELERNPLLETAEDSLEAGGDMGVESPDWADSADRAELPAADPPAAADALADDAKPPEDSLDVDLAEERFHHDSAADSPRGADGDEAFGIDQLSDSGESLAMVLTRQANARLSGIDLVLALAIIAAIDEAGYFTEPLADIAARLGTAEAEVERVLLLVQGFEPTGVGARTLAECIALQAKERDRYDPCMAALIDNLDLVARGDLATLRRLCSVDAEDLADMLRELRTYDPKPGLRYGDGDTLAIEPDVFVRRSARSFTVELNNATLPRIIVNRQYQARIARHAENHHDRRERQFLDACLAQAQWLIRALDQRASTILKVATEIVRQQSAFFDHGVEHLRPLTMRAVADAIEVHESTVSRVASNKYLSCDRGTFEFKFFFSSGVHAAGGGEDAAIEAVKAKLKALIDAEEPLKPLSDDRLVELLRTEGHELARRTVAKYREAMHIPSSYDRRRRALVNAA